MARSRWISPKAFAVIVVVSCGKLPHIERGRALEDLSSKVRRVVGVPREEPLPRTSSPTSPTKEVGQRTSIRPLSLIRETGGCSGEHSITERPSVSCAFSRIYARLRTRSTLADFLKGLDHVLRAQYPTGGWPQSFPPDKGYHRHITFNDGAMVNILEFLTDVAHSPLFSFVDNARRLAAANPLNRELSVFSSARSESTER